MRYTTSSSSGYGSSFYPSYFPPGVKWLLIVNTAVWLLFFFAARTAAGLLFQPFKLVPNDVVHGLAVWQLASYMFLHDPFGFGHILFNMLTLWMFGADLERTWGTRQFLRFYFLCGIGAGICVVAANAAAGGMDRATIGASGAIYGLLLAYGLLFPDRTVLFSFLFPMKAKYFVMILGAIAFLSSLGSGNSNVSNVAHLGGMIFGYIYLKSRLGRVRFDLAGSLARWSRERRMKRAKKKFQVYLNRQRHDHDRWVN
ncbi:MAG: rhomboid family intramembrane serine protease [Acidobacteria bacterium]|nr:rhomboid family intramembrane serine protease [Acidobacteriota bacterium]